MLAGLGEAGGVQALDAGEGAGVESWHWVLTGLGEAGTLGRTGSQVLLWRSM